MCRLVKHHEPLLRTAQKDQTLRQQNTPLANHTGAKARTRPAQPQTHLVHSNRLKPGLGPRQEGLAGSGFRTQGEQTAAVFHLLDPPDLVPDPG